MFKKDSEEEREHAHKFIEYQNKRGGRVVVQDIPKPSDQAWTALEAVKTALELEKSIHKTLLELHKMASQHDDAHLSDFIEGTFLAEQVEAEYQLSSLISKIERVGEKGLGVHIIDQELLKSE